MTLNEFKASLERFPVIATVHKSELCSALKSPAEILVHMKADLLTIKDDIEAVHKSGKYILVHIDLAEGIASDKTGIQYLYNIGVDGIISTRGKLIRQAKELGLITVQRFFALDSQGIESIEEMLPICSPDYIEIIPGVIGKVITRFSSRGIPVIAGGLIESKSEITEAISSGASAVSTGKEELWYV
ncbi:MAG: glycerol-3-phosphate responsive antiterminator [Acutalibacteraceae bacterium]|nr:glycerol-3-phosphate responsive antiterminator [Acutalibacteraceae bacterium]